MAIDDYTLIREAAPAVPLPPRNTDAEEAILGSVFIEHEAIGRVAAFLKPDDFYRERNGTIYAAMLALYDRREPIDYTTLADELGRRDQLEQVGGMLYLANLLSAVPTALHVEEYGHIVERTALMRRLISAGGKIAQLGFSDSFDVDTTLEKAEQLLLAVSQRRVTRDFESLSDVLREYLEQLEQLQEGDRTRYGIPTGFIDLDKLTGGLQRSDLVILAARPSMGKCLTAGTLIDDPQTGERLTIESYVRERRGVVYGVSTGGNVRPAAISDWVDSGVQPCYRVRTRTGRSVEVTGHHPFLTVNGWKSLGELGVGSHIGVPRSVPAFGTDETWPLDLVRLLAYYIAEGGLTGSCPAFTNTDPIIVDDFHRIVRDHFPECRIRQERITYTVARKKVRAIMPPNPVKMWLEPLGLWGKLARDKAFPSCVWAWSRRYLAEFLRTLLSCDGTIYPLRGFPRIEFGVASERLARDVHHALIRFGIVAKLYQRKSGDWRVEITEPASVQLYQTEIGWIGEKAGRFAKRERPDRRSNSGAAPRETWALVREATKQHGLTPIELARRSGETIAYGKYAAFNIHANRGIRSRRLGVYAEILDSEPLRVAGSSDLYWDVIATIEYIGEHQVYDLSVPDGSNFIAQDVCVHNTSLALNIGANAALKYRATVAMFSLEMSNGQLAARLLSTESGVDSTRLRGGKLNETEVRKLDHALRLLSDAPFYVDDTPGISIMELRSKARRLQADAGVDLIIVDYLQLIEGSRGRDNRVQEISEISRSLKALARELHVPVLALSQLSRAVESRSPHIPMLSDLRESGSIEQDSDIVMFIYREDHYNKDSEKKGIAEIHLAKHRNGPVGQVPLLFNERTTKFVDLEQFRG